jgi:phosphorylase kinase alpha/beta subunit
MTLIRTGRLLQLIAVRQRPQARLSISDALDELLDLPPHRFAKAIRDVLEHYQDATDSLLQRELMHVSSDSSGMVRVNFDASLDPDLADARDWHEWRTDQGNLARFSDGFFEGVWDIVNQSRGLVIGDQWNPKLRLDHSLCADMTRGEKLFKDRVTHILNKTPSPDSLQLYKEALQVLMIVMEQKPRAAHRRHPLSGRRSSAMPCASPGSSVIRGRRRTTTSSAPRPGTRSISTRRPPWPTMSWMRWCFC